MKRSVLMGCAGLAIAATAMAGPKVPQPAGSGQAIQPFAMAKVSKDANGNVRMVSDWMPVGSIADRGSTLRFDGAGQTSGAPETSDDCIAAGLPAGSRWWFGPAAINPHHASDYSMDDGAATEGGTLEGLDYQWALQATAPFILVVFPYSDYPADPTTECAIPTNGVDGVVFDFGTVPGGGGYFFTAITGISVLNIPLTANGYLEFVHAELVDETGITIASYPTQPMLYGTPGLRGEVGPGVSFGQQWDDDAPLDGVFAAGECYDYTFGVCPDPLSASFAIYTLGGGCPSADFNGDGFTDFFDYDDYVACFEGSCPPGLDADFNGDGFVDFFDYDDFVFAFEGCP